MKALLKNITNKNNKLPILKQVTVENGLARTINESLNVFVSSPVNCADGVYNPVAFGTEMQAVAHDEFAVDDSPSVPSLIGEAVCVNVSVADLEFIALAMSKEETRYYLNGVAVHDGGIVATDGHRLHFRELEGVDKGFSFIIPAHAVKMIIMSAKENKSKFVPIYLGDKLGYCPAGSSLVTFKAVDGTYPDWRRVFRNDMPKSGGLDISAIYMPMIKVARIKAKQAGGKRYSTVPLVGKHFNIDYLEPIVKNGAVSIGSDDSHSPVLFTYPCGLSAVLMPMREAA